MKRTAMVLALGVASAFLSIEGAHASTGLSWTSLWSHDHSINGQTSEIVSFDSLTNALWVVGVDGVDVLDVVSGSLRQHIDLTAFGEGNSISIYNGVAAVAVAASNGVDTGSVRFFDTANYANTGAVSVGVLPDMLTFTPDGTRLLVANEGERTATTDAPGSVSIIDMATRTVTATAGFANVPTFGGVRVDPNRTIEFDAEPEYIAVSADSQTAWVVLQENNALATLDLQSQSFTRIVGLGTKSFALPGNGIDANDKDGVIELAPVAARGLYQPDGIAAYEAGGKNYIVTANEGDARTDESDEARAKDLPGSVPAALERLTVSTIDSTSQDLVAFGARSFSIRDENGLLVFDSGNELALEAIARGIYDHGRSDNKGVEPEGVTVLALGGRTYAFIGLERTLQSAVAIYDVTDPTAASFIDMIVGADDIAPEGLTAFISGGQAFLAVANEVSSTTHLYALAPVPEPETWAMLLAGLGLIGSIARRRR